MQARCLESESSNLVFPIRFRGNAISPGEKKQVPSSFAALAIFCWIHSWMSQVFKYGENYQMQSSTPVVEINLTKSIYTMLDRYLTTKGHFTVRRGQHAGITFSTNFLAFVASFTHNNIYLTLPTTEMGDNNESQLLCFM